MSSWRWNRKGSHEEGSKSKLCWQVVEVIVRLKTDSQYTCTCCVVTVSHYFINRPRRGAARGIESSSIPCGAAR